MQDLSRLTTDVRRPVTGGPGQHFRFEDATRSAGEVLGLPADWPGPERPFERCKHRPGDHPPYDTDTGTEPAP